MAEIAYSWFEARVKGIIASDGAGTRRELNSAEVEGSIKEAVEEVYSSMLPAELVEDVTSTGAIVYDLEGDGKILPDFDPEFSKVVDIEHPIDETDYYRSLIGAEGWRVLNTPGGWKLRFTGGYVESGDDFRVYYTGPRVFDGNNRVSMPTTDKSAVANLAASRCFGILAAINAENTDPSIAADTADTKSISEHYLSLQKTYYKLFETSFYETHPKKPAIAKVQRA